MRQTGNTNISSIEREETAGNRSRLPNAAPPMGPMTVEHEQWDEFIDLLLGERGCDFHLVNPEDNSSAKWKCDCSDTLPISRRILREMGLTPDEVEQSAGYFASYGGCCDCEVWLNVDRLPADGHHGPPSKQVLLNVPGRAPAIQERDSAGAINPSLLTRVEVAIKEQPEFGVLRAKLLEHGGKEVVPPCAWDAELRRHVIVRDPDLPALVDHGYLMTGPVVCRSRGMEPNRCHQNIARLWLQKRKRDALVGIATGYCLDNDLWRQHSFGMRKDSLLETLGEREKYFGIRLEGIDADVFAFKTLGKDEADWPSFNIDLLVRVLAELNRRNAVEAGCSM